MTRRRTNSSATARRPDLGADVGRLWTAHLISRLGVAFSNGVMLVVAVTHLGASAAGVAGVFGAAQLAGAVAASPLGVLVERRRKRSVLIATDLGRAVASLCVPVLLWTGQLSLAALAIVLAVDAFLTLVGASAAQAHLNDLVPPADHTRVFARLDSTDWIITAIFTPLGGATLSVLGPAITLSIDAATYLVSAALLSSIRQVERAPLELRFRSMRHFGVEAVAGWRVLWFDPTLRSLFLNAMTFGAGLVLVSPLLAVLALRDLGLAPWQYAIVLGVPAVGGALGSAVSARIQRRHGSARTLLAFGSIRTLWTVWLALSPHGAAGFAFVLVAEFLLMTTAGVFNPVFSARRLAAVDDDHQARVGAAWSVTARLVQPLAMLVGGALVVPLGLRGAIAAGGCCLLASSALLPWRSVGRLSSAGAG